MKKKIECWVNADDFKHEQFIVTKKDYSKIKGVIKIEITVPEERRELTASQITTAFREERIKDFTTYDDLEKRIAERLGFNVD